MCVNIYITKFEKAKPNKNHSGMIANYFRTTFIVVGLENTKSVPADQ